MPPLPNYQPSTLSEESIAGLVRDDLGPFSFAAVLPHLRALREDLDLAVQMPDETLPQNLIYQIGQQLQQLNNHIGQIKNFDVGASNPKQTHETITNQLIAVKDAILQAVRPMLRPIEAMNATLQDAQAALVRIGEKEQELDSTLSALKSSAVSTGASTTATYYQTAATNHGGTANRWLAVGAVAGGLLLVSVLGAFVWVPPVAEQTSSTAEVINFTRGVITRAFILAIPAIVLSFSLRNYRVNKHLQTLNESRANALETAALFQAGVTSDEARNLVVAELVRAIFASGETGYLGGDSDKTVIENPGATIAALASLNHRSG